MPTTYSTSLRLSLMATGEQAGNWGTITNTNLGTLLEQAICGYVAVTVSGVGDTTLTNLNGASDEARNMVVELIGSPGAARNVIVPTAEKVYLVRNSTSGGYAMTVKTSAGTGASIAAGDTAWVYCDGTNIVQGSAQYNASTNTMVGNLVGNVTGDVTGSASLNVLKSGDTMTGNLTVSKASPVVSFIRPSSGTSANIESYVSSNARWVIAPGDQSSETGSNAGSNFLIARYSDAGSYIDNPLTISRATGVTDFTSSPTIAGSPMCPPGVMMPYAGSSAPSGWLMAAGQAISRTTYAALFAAIGTVYGAGDGSTTFNVPDLRGRAIFGRDDMGGSAANRITNAVSGITGTTLGATGGNQNLAAHTHTVTDPGHTHTLTDPGHNHTLTDPGHSHGPSTGTSFWGNGGTTGSGQPTGGGFGYTGTTTALSTTGVTIASSTTGITNASNTTGISVASTGTGASANVPPAIIMNYIIKA